MAQLRGMAEITKYTRRSEVTILKFIRELKFPARKISVGIWESDTELVDEWRKHMIINGLDDLIDQGPRQAADKSGSVNRKGVTNRPPRSGKKKAGRKAKVKK